MRFLDQDRQAVTSNELSSFLSERAAVKKGFYAPALLMTRRGTDEEDESTGQQGFGGNIGPAKRKWGENASKQLLAINKL